MQKVKILLSAEISRGLINWEKLNKKLQILVETMRHSTGAIGPDGKSVQVEDAASFKYKDNDALGNKMDMSIKLFELRFQSDGEIYCSAIQKGFYQNGKPTFPFPKDLV